MLRSLLLVMCGSYLVGLSVYLVLRQWLGDQFWWLALINVFFVWIFAPLILTVPLLVALRNRPLLLYAIVLSAAAALHFSSYLVPKAHATTGGTSIKIVTFNTWPDNPHMDQVEAWLRTTNADVVFLQENPRHPPKNDVAALRDLYPYQFVQPRWDDILLLSKFPFESTESFVTAPEGITIQQRAVIKIRDQQVALYNIHLEIPFGDHPRLPARLRSLPFMGRLAFATAYDDASRNSEIDQIVTRLNAELLPYIMCGDFNLSDSSMPYYRLAAFMGDSFREAGTGFGLSWPVAQIQNLTAFVPTLVRMDYVWHSAVFTAVDATQGPFLGSDHLPVVVTLVLK